MRKDVKLGFAIGGVLLAVLIVYVLVVPGGAGSKNKSRQTNTGGGKVALEPVAPPSATAEALPGAVVSAGVKPGTDPFASAKSAVSPDAAQLDPLVPVDSKSKDLDWNKILNDQPVLMTQTPVASGSVRGATPATPAIDGKTPPVEPAASSSTPNIIEPGPTPMPSLSPTPDVPAVADSAAGAVPAVTPLVQPTGTGPESVRTHVIRQGETLSSISAAAYGSPNFYPAILKANPGIDPTHLKTGEAINLPDIAAAKSSPSSPAEASQAPAKLALAIDATKQYRVQTGDSLHKIAMHLYGRSDQADKIYELNKQTIGTDPHRLKVGQVLQLPSPPTQTTQSQTTAHTDSSR